MSGQTYEEAHEIADRIARLDDVSAALEYRSLPKGLGLEVFEELNAFDQQRLLSGMRDDAYRQTLEAMDPDDRSRLLQEAPAVVVKRALAGLSHHERTMTAQLLGYPKGSVGRYMSPEVVTLREGLAVGEALEIVRAKGARADNVYTLAVVNDSRCLVGPVALSDLVLSEPGRALASVVDGDAITLVATDEAEGAARLIQETNEPNLLVVDSEHRLVGLLSYDDAMEVLEEADSEDAARQSGAEPWEGHYTSVGVFRLARYRALWLSLLLVAATLTVSVTQAFEATLAEVAALALFIPMLIGAGGNAGAQAATASVRALAVGELKFSDLGRVVWREVRVGLLLGLMLALLGFLVGAAFVGWQIATVLACSLILVCAWAATIGGAMPLIARRLGIDPAVVSAPLVTTLVDATGLVIYFLMARLILGL
ncbi:magnesium transporter [Tessaracoccus bendigoensis DSM 12906]|uniref:Magnesium transporter MgtE n=1 Tax=Tessaracoccus bendigoensis DSM 12906 TaxID=1123357 RepID=A0A1M6AB32_9ACTN|nr:magnesium transporter [Tessaracoccus bendigoensis]SHI33680.1 magnesium transporter [Tessaracoccus bendigoensis DSM 12906]